MSTIWEIREPAEALATELPYSALIQKLLALRGFESEADVQNFLFPSLDHLIDPQRMKGIPEAAKRILSAAHRGERVMIHGDYDVDGVTGAAILSRTLEKLNAKYDAFLPDRKKDGYGVSRNAIDLAKTKNMKLLITVDCGINAFDEIQAAREAGIDVIVIDHHRIHNGKLPQANIVINPLQEDCTYPFKELSAGGLAFKLSHALLGQGAFDLLDLASLSTVCDVAPLFGENRIIVTFGLDCLSSRKQLGFRALAEVSKLKRKRFYASDLGFVLGPRINAAGRLGSPARAHQLLTTEDPNEAESLAKALDVENKARQKEDRALLKLALQTVEREINFNRDKVIVVAGEGWHEGVIGIVAQRLVERFARPAVVISFDGETGKGSGRSLKGFHLFHGLQFCATTLEEFGGHELAAGFKINRKHFKSFRLKLNEFAKTIPADVFSRSIRIDLEIGLSDLSPLFLKEMSLLEPFGAGNPRPVFLTRGIRTKKKPQQQKFGGIKWWLTDGVNTFEASWNAKDPSLALPETEPYTIAYTPKVKSWDGIDSLVLEIRDVKGDRS